MAEDFISNLTRDLQKQNQQSATNTSAQNLNFNKDVINNLTQVTKGFDSLNKGLKTYVLEKRKVKMEEDKQYKERKNKIKDEIKLNKEHIATLSKKIFLEKNLEKQSGIDKYFKKIKDLDLLLQDTTDVNKAKQILLQGISTSNKNLGFDIAKSIEPLFKDIKGGLSLSEIINVSGTKINEYTKNEISNYKEKNQSHASFMKIMDKRIGKENLGIELFKKSLHEKTQLNDKEIGLMEKRMFSWSKQDGLKYAQLNAEKEHLSNLQDLTKQSLVILEAQKMQKEKIEEMSVDYARDMSDKLLAPLKSIPLLGETLGNELGEKLEKSLAPKFKNLIASLLYKKGDVANGMDPAKIGTLVGSLGTAVTATAGLVLVLGAVMAAGYAFYKLFDSIVGKAVELDNSATDFAKSLGTGYTQGYKLAKVTKEVSKNLQIYGVAQEAITSNAAALFDAFNMKNASEGNITMLTKLTEAYGIAATEGAKVITDFSNIFGMSENKMDRFFSELQANSSGAGVSFKGIIEDVSSNMEDIVAYGSDNVKNIVDAGIKAKQMGNNLQSAFKLRDSFKDLPSAIEKASALSLLTGQRIDGYKLFVQAQTGKIDDIQDTILKNMAIFETQGKKFSQIPLTIKEIWAETTGQSQEELAKMFEYSGKSATEIKAIRDASKDWENALANTTGLWDKIKNIAKTVYMQAIMPIVEDFSGMIKEIKDGMNSQVLNGIVKSAKEIGKYLGVAWESVKNIFGIKIGGLGFWESFKDILDSIGGVLSDFFTNKFDGVQTKFEHLLTMISDTATKLWNIMTDDKASIWEKLKDSFSTMFHELAIPISMMLRKAIYKTSPRLASVLGISGTEVAREQAVMEWEKNKSNPEEKGKMFAEAWSDLNKLKPIESKWSTSDSNLNENELKISNNLKDKYGTDNLHDIKSIIETKLKTYEDYEGNYQLAGEKQKNINTFGQEIIPLKEIEEMNSKLALGGEASKKLQLHMEDGLGTKGGTPYLKTLTKTMTGYFDNQLIKYKKDQISQFGSIGGDVSGMERASSIKKAADGMLVGPSHASGGIPARVGKGMVELEGGEAIINKRSMRNPSLRKLASMINRAGGGVDFSGTGKYEKGGFIEFANALAQRESSGVLDVVNKYGYMGLYQFGKDTLKTLGMNVSSDQFLHSKNLQDEALKRNIDYHVGPKDRFGFSKYYGAHMYGTNVTPSGVYGAAHLKGAGGAKNLLKGKDNKDANGTYASEYLKKFGNYNLGINSLAGGVPEASGRNKINSSVFSMIPSFENGGMLFDDGGTIDKLKHDIPHRVAHTGAEVLAHKVGAALLSKMLLYSGNILDPTELKASAKTPEMVKEEYDLIRKYYKEHPVQGPLPKPKNYKKKKKYAAGGSLIEPIADSSFAGISNLFGGFGMGQSQNTNKNSDDSNIPSGDFLNRIGGNEANPEKTWNGVKQNVKNLWNKVAGKFGNTYVTDAIRYGKPGPGSGGQHQLGLAIDIGAPHAKGRSSKNPPERGVLDNVANFLAQKFGVYSGGDWSGVTKGNPKGQLLWRTNAGGNHFNHVHASLKPGVELGRGGYLKAATGMEANIDSQTMMTLGNKKIITGDNSSGKETVSIKPRETRDREMVLNEEAVKLLRELVAITKVSSKKSMNLDGKAIMKNTLNHLAKDIT